MTRIISLNLNGIRSACQKGFLEWLDSTQADIICLQEVRAQECDMTAAMKAPPGWHTWFSCAERRGYAGTGLISRRPADRVISQMGVEEFDREGRYLEAHFGNLVAVSVYLPSGSASEERQAAKYRFMEAFYPHLRQLKLSGREVVVCGDWNIAHREIDLKNWKGNLKNSGFLPEERAWMSRVFDELGFVDVTRRLAPEEVIYTWWSNRGQAYAKNVGWRIDYQVATPGLADRATGVAVYKDKKFSDHAPLIIDYDYPL